jgi:hypothetical protein
MRRFGVFCERAKNFAMGWNRGEWIDVRMSVANLLNHGRRFVRSRICEKEGLKNEPSFCSDSHGVRGFAVS